MLTPYSRRSPSLFFLALSVGVAYASNGADRCLEFARLTTFENTTIISSTYVAGNNTVQPWGVCATDPVPVPAPICRLLFSVRASNSSEVKAEAWLPDEWYDRFLAIGNGGLGGCIDYNYLNYGSSYHFATFASNHGHDGNQGHTFYKQPEVLQDFASRSIHAVSVVGKQIVEAYYSQPHSKSYFLGCSAGGRQGTYSALHWPEDFDGIIGASAATNWNILLGSVGMNSIHVGAPEGNTSASFVPTNLWATVRAEIISQCDALDGVEDGILDEPDLCRPQLEVLLCSEDAKETEDCLTEAQLRALKKVYSPLIGPDGEVLHPGYAIGADATVVFDGMFSGNVYPLASEWWKYVVKEDPDYDLADFGLEDILAAEALDPFQISTFSGEFSKFAARGGKFLTYHGTHDNIIPPGNAQRAFDLALDTMGNTTMDKFYRLFMIPGMDHCGSPWSEGPFMIGHYLPLPPKNDSDHNILLALVDWVEGDQAPDTVVGTSSKGEERLLCRYPLRSVWNGTRYTCQA